MNINNLLKSDFIKNMSFQIIGVALAQLLPLLCMPFLTRIYSETDFALFTTFMAIGSIFAVGAGCRYQFAIMLPKHHDEAKNIILNLIYILSLLLFFITFPSLNFNLGKKIYLLPIFVLFFGLWNSFSNLSIRYGTFKINSIAKVLQSIIYIIASISLGLLKLLSLGLIIGKILGTLVSSIYLFQKSEIYKINTNYSALKVVAQKYVDYPKYSFIPSFLDTASSQALALVIIQFYSKQDLGFFGLTFMVLSAPVSLIGASFKEVFYQKITFLINDSKFNESLSLFKKSSIGLLIIGLPVCIIIMFFGKEVFSLIFGIKWGISGTFASILAIGFFIQLIVSPLSSIFNAANKLKISSIWQTLYFITTFVTLGIAAYAFKVEIETLFYIYIIHELILYSIYFILQYKTLQNLN